MGKVITILAFLINRIAAAKEYIYRRRARADLSEKCPNCGHRKPHPIEQVFDAAGKSCVKHTCSVCHAEFMENSVMKSDEWTRPPQPPKPPLRLA